MADVATASGEDSGRRKIGVPDLNEQDSSEPDSSEQGLREQGTQEHSSPEHTSSQQQIPGIVGRDITVTYNNGHTALRNASFSIPNATICALVGVNGSGKSTLFKAIMGFVPLASGSVDILGKPAGRALKRNTVAYVPQNEDVDWDFPVLVEDVVMMGRYGHMGLFRRPSAKDHKLVESALQRVDMLEYRDRQIGQLSGGQKKRVFLARALAQESRIILLDEPFTGVDVKTEESIIALMRGMRDEGRVMLVSTHNLGSVPQFCDHVVLINRTVLADGPAEEVFTRKNLENAFGGVLRFHVLGGQELHDDDDAREVTVITDDERPFVLYGKNEQPDGDDTLTSEPDSADQSSSQNSSQNICKPGSPSNG